MLQQCKKSCGEFAAKNDNILQDTSDTCVNFALRGGCQSDPKKASSVCRASCHIQSVCANHTETVTCSKALRCEPIGDMRPDCASRAAAGKCESEPRQTLKECLKSCSEVDLAGLMRFHLPHMRTRLSPLIDLPGKQPRLAGFYQTPPSSRNTDLEALALCDPVDDGSSHARKDAGYFHAQKGHGGGGERPSFAVRMREYRKRAKWRQPWGRYHWDKWDFSPGRERTPRVPHRFSQVPEEEGSSRMVTVQHISFSPRIRYLHRLLSAEECDHILRVAQPLFSRSPVRGSVTRVRTSTTAMLGGRHDDAVVTRVRERIARFSGFPSDLLEPLQVVRYERGQKYEGHHDFFDVCDVEDKTTNGRRQVTFLIYLVDMPPGEEGGGTRFPELQLEVAPEKGSAIVFNDCFDNGAEDGRTLHAGQPPIQAATVKYGA
jgi:prolyl 4-hydroxylase